MQEFSNDDLTDDEKIAEQDIIDIGAIGLALLLRKIPE